MKWSAIIVTAALALPGTISATVIRVDLHGGGDFETIQEGLNAAAEGDTVLVALGWYSGPLNRGLDFGGTNIVLLSEAGPHHTIIDCEGADRGLDFHSGEGLASVVDGFRITNGAAYAGAGINCSDYSSPTIRNCHFRANAASSGGGGLRCSDSSSPSITNVTFSANSATYGGGMIARYESCPALRNVVFTHNAGVGGGGMRCERSSYVSLYDVVFSKNEASVCGGGLADMDGAWAGLTNVTFLENSAPTGGGMVCYHATATVTNCTFAMNSATTGHGISFEEMASGQITNTIIAFSSSGTPLHCGPGGEPVMTRSCVYGNAGGDSLCGSHWDNLFTDPLFCDMMAGDLTLHADSPCLPANNPWAERIGAWGLGCGATDVEEMDGDNPVQAVSLSVRSAPNPFGHKTTIQYDLPQQASNIELAIYDLRGRKVRALAHGPRSRGPHTAIWDGNDESGRSAASGVYFCVLTAGQERVARSVVLLR